MKGKVKHPQDYVNNFIALVPPKEDWTDWGIIDYRPHILCASGMILSIIVQHGSEKGMYHRVGLKIIRQRTDSKDMAEDYRCLIGYEDRREDRSHAKRVYVYVPVDTVNHIIENNGGIKEIADVS